MSIEVPKSKPEVVPSKDVEASGGADENDNIEGTFYQSQLGSQAKRRHFFGSLDQAYADAVHKDAETVLYTDKEEVSCSSVCSDAADTCVYRAGSRGRLISQYSL
jgi:hypothetical protein